MQQLPFDKRSGKIWFNNELCEWQDARVHIISHGMHYASLVFEGLRVYNTKIFKLEEHTDRLFNSAKILDMKIPYSYNEIIDATKKLVSDQNIQNGYVRPFVWRGSEMMGVSAQNTKINVAIAIWDWPTYFDPDLKLKGIKLNISKWKRPDPSTAPVNTKAAGLYMICTLSKHEAENLGYDDSLMLDYRGYIAEATGANIFFVKDNEIHTPIADCFLNGITRQTVINIAENENLKVKETRLKIEELSQYDECFVTGTAAEVTPVKSINEIKFFPGKICKLLIEKYTNLTKS